MSCFYISDTHFGHENSIRYDKRPFSSAEEMDEEMIYRWNSVVKKKDNVYIVGDFAFRSAKSVSEYTNRLNGHLHLILGNHDRLSSLERNNSFSSTHEILRISDNVFGTKRKVVLCHYWIPFVPEQRHGGFMLHGHTHATLEHVLEEEAKQKIRDNDLRCEAYNVGCMFQDYAPMTLEQVIQRQDRKNII